MSKQLHFWFDFASTYTYPAVMRASRLARQQGVEVVWHAFLLGAVFQQYGWNDSPFNLWDCRSKEEYTGERLAARRGGHIPNAFHLEWSTALDRQDSLRIRPLELIRQKLLDRGLDEQKAVVVYCQTHHRSGLAYVLARLLNLRVRAYDGAWSEWGNRLDTPIVTGEQPL